MIDLVKDVGLLTYKSVEKLKSDLQSAFNKDFFLEESFRFYFQLNDKNMKEPDLEYTENLSIVASAESRHLLKRWGWNTDADFKPKSSLLYSNGLADFTVQRGIAVGTAQLRDTLVANYRMQQCSEVYVQLADKLGTIFGSYAIDGTDFLSSTKDSTSYGNITHTFVTNTPLVKAISKIFSDKTLIPEIHKHYVLHFKFALDRYHMNASSDLLRSLDAYLKHENLLKIATGMIRDLMVIPVPVLEYLFNGTPEIPSNKQAVNKFDEAIFPAYGITDIGDWINFCKTVPGLAKEHHYRYDLEESPGYSERHVLYHYTEEVVGILCQEFDDLLAKYSNHKVIRSTL